jgi:hypothetical protein
MDTATLIGRKVTLAQEFRGFAPDTVWEVKNATSVGGKVILAVNNGSKGLAAPIEMFVVPEAEPVAPAPKPRATRFKMDGAEKDSPLYEVFQKCAPDDELSKELYMMYQSEYSEFDTDFLGTLAGQVNATFEGKWTKEQVGEMLQLINSSYDEAALAAEPLPAEIEVVEGPVVETAEVVETDEPEPIEQPAIRAVTEEILASALDNLPPLPAPPVKRGRGRPPGSRNRPKLDAALTLLRDDAEGVLARTPVNETKELARKVIASNTPADMIAVSLELATAIAKAAAASGDEFDTVLDHAFGIVENLF